MDYRYGPALRDRVAGNLTKFTPRAHAATGLKRAAVAITLVADAAGEEGGGGGGGGNQRENTDSLVEHR